MSGYHRIGKDFSAAGHLSTLQQGAANPDELESTVGFLADELNKTIRAFYGMSCPVLAAVNGRAAGAGFSLAMACDIRIASERAVFNFAYARVGATPDGGMTWFLPRIVGMSRAIELLMQSPILRPKHALELGWCRPWFHGRVFRTSCPNSGQATAKHPRHYVGTVKELTRDSAPMPTSHLTSKLNGRCCWPA